MGYLGSCTPGQLWGMAVCLSSTLRGCRGKRQNGLPKWRWLWHHEPPVPYWGHQGRRSVLSATAHPTRPGLREANLPTSHV